LSFAHRKAQDYTWRGEEPPNPLALPDWAENTRNWRVRIELNRASLPETVLADPYFWYVGVHDASNQEIYRQGVSREELIELFAPGTPYIILERQFDSIRKPVTWTVWPVSRFNEWLQKIQGPVDF